MTCPTCGCACGGMMNFNTIGHMVGQQRVIVVDVDGDKAARIGALIDRIKPMIEDRLASMRDRAEEVRARIDDFAETAKDFSIRADRDDDKPFYQRINRKTWEKR